MNLVRKVGSAVQHYKFYNKWSRNESSAPESVSFCLTMRCNMLCRMCAFWRYSSREPELNSQQICATIRELKGMGTEALNFTGGEPTLRRDFSDIVLCAGKLGFNLSMTTNGTRISPQLAELIARYFSSVRFSIHSAEPEVHDHMMGRSGAFAEAVRGLRLLSEARAKLDSPLEISTNTVVCKVNFESLTSLLRLRDIAPIDHVGLSPISVNNTWLPHAATFDIEEFRRDIALLDLTREDIEKYNEHVAPVLQTEAHALKQGVSREWAFIFGRGDSINDYLHHGRSRGIYNFEHTYCVIPFVSADITPTGNVLPCSPALISESRYIMGNLRERPFAEIWNDRRYKAFRNGCKPPKFDMCRSCCVGTMEANIALSRRMRQISRFIPRKKSDEQLSFHDFCAEENTERK